MSTATSEGPSSRPLTPLRRNSVVMNAPSARPMSPSGSFRDMESIRRPSSLASTARGTTDSPIGSAAGPRTPPSAAGKPPPAGEPMTTAATTTTPSGSSRPTTPLERKPSSVAANAPMARPMSPTGSFRQAGGGGGNSTGIVTNRGPLRNSQDFGTWVADPSESAPGGAVASTEPDRKPKAYSPGKAAASPPMTRKPEARREYGSPDATRPRPGTSSHPSSGASPSPRTLPPPRPISEPRQVQGPQPVTSGRGTSPARRPPLSPQAIQSLTPRPASTSNFYSPHSAYEQLPMHMVVYKPRQVTPQRRSISPPTVRVGQGQGSSSSATSGESRMNSPAPLKHYMTPTKSSAGHSLDHVTVVNRQDFTPHAGADLAREEKWRVPSDRTKGPSLAPHSTTPPRTRPDSPRKERSRSVPRTSDTIIPLETYSTFKTPERLTRSAWTRSSGHKFHIPQSPEDMEVEVIASKPIGWAAVQHQQKVSEYLSKPRRPATPTRDVQKW